MIVVGTNHKGMKLSALLIKMTMIAMSIEIIDKTKAKVQAWKFQPVRLCWTKLSIIPIQ